MLNADRFFQTLLAREIAALPGGYGGAVGADLDTDSFEEIPFVTHRSLVAQDRNAPGLYSVTVSINLFIDVAEVPFSWVVGLYDAIQAWGSAEMTGVVTGVAAVEQIDEEIAAFDRLSGGVQMLGKTVTQLNGSWRLTVRKL